MFFMLSLFDCSKRAHSSGGVFVVINGCGVHGVMNWCACLIIILCSHLACVI